jgi:PBSX family phage portal protein
MPYNAGAERPAAIRRRSARWPTGTGPLSDAIVPLGRSSAVQPGAELSDARKVAKGEFTSNQVPDPFLEHMMGSADYLNIVEMPYNIPALMRMATENNALQGCIDAMVTNVYCTGYRLEYVGPDGDDVSAAAQAEKEVLEAFLARPNGDYSFAETLKRTGYDMEHTANAYWEVARDPSSGEVTAVWHMPSANVRLTCVEDEPVQFTQEILRRGSVVKQRVHRRFRRYVQMVGTKKVFFKELGDPRLIDPATGKENPKLSYEDSANEVIHHRRYTPGSPYGVPRWVPQLPSILGSRQAELTNLDHFNENAIPAMAILVSGGYLPENAIADLEDQLSSARGRESRNRILVLEAMTDNSMAPVDGALPAPKIEIKPLTDARQSEGAFLKYIADCASNVRSSFRIPPLFVGRAEDHSFATAKTSFAVAESQVFGPERTSMDDVIDHAILSSLRATHWTYRANPPSISDPQEVIDALRAFNEMGAMTPNTAIDLANEVFDMGIPRIMEEWGNFPFAVVSALAVAGRIKGFEEIMIAVDTGVEGVALPGDTASATENGSVEEEVVKSLASLRKALLPAKAARVASAPLKLRQRRAVTPGVDDHAAAA